MVGEVRVYVEGGGDSKFSKSVIRQGFNGFFKEIVEYVRSHRLHWQVIACGSRNSAYDLFLQALKTHPDAFNILLVDSEGPVCSSPREHLVTRDGWSLEKGLEEHCNLMVQTFESWLIADSDALRRFYGKGFGTVKIRNVQDVESLDKSRVMSLLEAATKKTQKGEYHKIHHCSKLLAMIDSRIVREKACHCERLFTIIEKRMGMS